MTPHSLLAELRNRGVEPVVRDGRLKLRGPVGRITPEMVERVKAFRVEIRALADLQSRQSAPDALPHAGHPAYSILETCRSYWVALRIDATGDLVVGQAGAKANEPTQPWRTLLIAIEANLEAVARLVEAGWHLRATFPPNLV